MADASGSQKKSGAESEKSQADQLIDLLVYAPVGLIYEYGEVLPQLVKRGKSQVQLAKVMSQMAAKQGQKSVDGALLEAAGTLAKGITEFGTLLGLAPDADAPPPPTAADVIEVVEADAEKATDTAKQAQAPKKATAKSKKQPEAKKAATASAKKKQPKKKSAKKSTKPARLPIARYDDLTAREIVPLLDDLSADQRTRIRKHELANRKRKTIMAKLDRLG